MPAPYYSTTPESDIVVVFERLPGLTWRRFRGYVVTVDGQHVEVHTKTCGCGCASMPLTPSRTS